VQFLKIITMNNYLKPILAIIFTLYFFIFVSAQENHDAPVHLKIKRLNDSYIDVYYNKPVNKSRMPLLIFCQGSGYDSNTEGFLGIMHQFQNKAVGLAIEKQGVNYGDKGDTLSEIYKQNNTVYNRLYDYLRVLQYLKVYGDWWNGDVYVIGGSEGGLLAGMLACYYPNIKALALFSFGGGLNFGEAWPISSGLQKKAEGANAVEIEKEVNTVKDSLNYIRQNPIYQKSYSGDDNTYAWWASIIDLRLENALLDLQIPIFLAQGTEDMMAPPISAQKLHEDFVKKGKTNLYYKEYKGYNHEYKDEKNKSHLVEVVTEGIKWMLEKK
jgi:pimeloyl-ACP methyl ester carboxylesterase